MHFKKNECRFTYLDENFNEPDEEHMGDLSHDMHESLKLFAEVFLATARSVQTIPEAKCHEILQTMIPCFQNREYEPSAKVVGKGEAPGWFYIAEGSCLSKGQSYHKGSIFGLEYLLEEGECGDDVVSGCQGMTCFEISREDTLGVCALHEEMFKIMPFLLKSSECLLEFSSGPGLAGAGMT